MKNGHKIITDYRKIPALVKKYRKEGKKIVLTSGSFDMLHIGHCRYLCEAKKFGDVLFVGVDSDKKIKKRKGPERPVVPEEERLEMLTYIEDVGHVVLKKLNQPKWKLIKMVKPDILVAIGETYSKEQLGKLKEVVGEIVIMERRATTSTSAKIRLVQIGAEKRITKTISKKLIAAVEDILQELKD